MKNISQIRKRLFRDNSDVDAPKGTHKFALNAVNGTDKGDSNFLAVEEANKELFSLTEGYIPLGKAYIGDGEVAIWSTSPTTQRDEIGVVDSKGNYTVHVNGNLGFKITNQIDATYRLRRGCDKTVYWVDGKNNPPMFYDFNNPNDFKTGGIWDKKKFHIQGTYSDLPEFLSIKVIEGGGQTPSGSYNVGIQYLDENLNATAILYTSSALNIYVDSIDGNYVEVEGSIESNMNSFNFPVTDKAIEVTVNVDQSFKYYRLVFIEFTSGDGTLTNIKYTQNIPTTTNVFLYTGENYSTLGTEGEVLQVSNTLGSGDSIEQIDNRLIIANTTGDISNPCKLQSIVSLITTDVIVKEVVANSIVPGNTKSPTSHFESVGYQPGEIYSLGFVPVYEDNSEGPVYHIVGKNPSHGAGHIFSPGDDVYPMAINNSCINSTYVGNDTCDPGSYWGEDSFGEDLEGAKVRHHRFPYRSDIDVPMVTETESDITTLGITNVVLNAFGTINTPCSQEQFDNGECSSVTVAEPFQIKVTVDVNGDTKIFYITIDPQDFYDPSTSATINISELSENYYDTPVTVVSIEEETSTNTWVVIEDGVPSPKGLEFNTSLEESQTNKTKGNFRTNVYGIKLSNIDLASMNAISEKKIVGYHIVRNERKESDKTILDSAILTPCVNSKNANRNLWGKHPDDTIGDYHKTFNSENLKETYIANGLLSPVFSRGNIRPTYSAGALEIGTTANSGFLNSGERISKEFFGMIHPEHKFNDKKYPTFSRIRHEGTFTVSSRAYDTFMYQDVVDGTTYDATIHRNKFDDDDGYSLRGGVRDSKLSYRTNTKEFDIDKSNTREVAYLDALHDKSFEGLPENLWNLSADNKTGIIRTNTPINTPIKDNYPYVYIERDIADPYGDFRSLPYYKITHKLETTTELNVFEGDAYITPMRYFSSMLIEEQPAFRVDKNSVWKIVAGSLMIAGAALATIFSWGVASFTTALIPQAISMIASGIKEQKLIEAYQQEYTKGLKECLIDADTFQGFKYYPSRDDEIQWFGEVLTDLWFESKVNISLRHDMTDGDREYFMGAPGVVSGKSFMDYLGVDYIPWGGNKNIHLLENKTVAPSEAVGIYLMKKLLGQDNSRKDNKKYLVVPPGELYRVNPDFDRMNKQKLFFHLGIEYDCCSDCQESFPHRVWYSEQSFQEELSDNFKIFLPNNYRDIQGETGKITDLFVWQNNLYIHTEEALWHLPQNYQERVTDQITTYIGTGEFFSIPPRKVLDDEQSSGGTQHKWATNKNEYGVFFVSEKESKFYKFDGRLKPITVGLNKWFLENTKLQAVDYYNNLGQTFKNTNNPSNPLGVGFISVFDEENNRVIFTKKDFSNKSNLAPNGATYCEVGGQGYFNMEYQYIIDVYTSLGWTYKEMQECNLVFYRNDSIEGYVETVVSAGDSLVPVDAKIVDSSWTMSFDVTPTEGMPDGGWVSWHSYLPRFYYKNNNKFISWNEKEEDNSFWEHNMKGKYQNFYGIKKPFIVEYVSMSEPLKTKICEDIILHTEARRYDPILKEYFDVRDITFTKGIFYNTRQCTGLLNFKVKDTDSPEENYMSQQIVNLDPGTIILDRNERNWSLNDLRDIRIDYNTPIFNSNGVDLQDDYYIDKVLNVSSLDENKIWSEQESLRDKFLVVRLIFDTFDDVKLVMNYSIEDETDSPR